MVLVTFGPCSCSREIKLSNEKWYYAKGVCEVTFTIRNNEDNEATRIVRILAHRLKDIGKVAVVNDIIGEKTVVVHLKPREKLEVRETISLMLNLRPSMVVVTHFAPE